MGRYKQLLGKCITCLGCNLLENPNFTGKQECKYYIGGVKDEQVQKQKDSLQWNQIRL